MKNIEISKSEARRFLIRYQGLDGREDAQGEKGVLKYIKKVGCIQYDPLNVVGRNPDLVLQSRIRDYDPSILENMLYKERSLIDGWDKMMSIYLKEDWNKCHRIREKKEEEIRWTLERRGSLSGLEVKEDVKKIIGEKGPLAASQIDLGRCEKGRWGHGKKASVAMDYLYNIGELGIHKKKNAVKTYDLIEKILDGEDLNDYFENDKEFYKWYFKRRVGSVGLIWGRNGGGWLGKYIEEKKLRTSILNELVDEGQLKKVKVEGIKETFYMRSEDLSILESIGEVSEPEIRFLAPLDNLLWDRLMVEKIFDFKYSWEVYIPVAKRKYGYYVLPVLYGERLIARFEPEHQRGNEPLKIKNWWWEDGVDINDDMLEKIETAFDRFCKYLGADGKIIEGSLF